MEVNAVEGSRERVREKRKQQKQAQVRMLLRIFCGIVVFSVLYYFLHRPWLAFGKLEVVNGTAITVEEVKKLADIKEPVNVFNISCSQIERVLENDLRVEKVSTGYGWPNVLKIYVNERKPAVYVECAYGGYAKIAASGHVLEVGKGIKDATAPFVSGWKLGNIYTGDKVDDEGMLALLKFLSKLDKTVQGRIAEIVMEPNSKIKILLSSGIPIIIGDYQDLEKKIDTFNTVYNELETKRVKAAYIDLSFEKPYIKLR